MGNIKAYILRVQKLWQLSLHVKYKMFYRVFSHNQKMFARHSQVSYMHFVLCFTVNETNSSTVAHAVGTDVCLRENSLLYLLLCLGTLWLGISLYNFTKTWVSYLPWALAEMYSLREWHHSIANGSLVEFFNSSNSVDYHWFFCILFFRPYLNASKREILADYALPFAVIIMSFFGSYVFRGVKCKYALYRLKSKRFVIHWLKLWY